MKVHFKLKLIFWLALGVLLGWTGGPAYCFSPGHKVIIENFLTGCECQSSCQQIEESSLLSQSFRRDLPSSETPSPILKPLILPEKKNLILLTYDTPEGARQPHPLLFVKLLF